MNKTRKNTRGGGLLDVFTGKKPNAPAVTASNLKAKRNYNLAHSKSKVANYLTGNFKYTNKARIEDQYQKALAELKKIEKPAETQSALRTVAASLETALKTNTARKAGAITITIPIGVAQLAYKAMMVFLAAMAFLFVDLPSMGSVPLSPYLMPNKEFNTTREYYNAAKRATGVGKAAGVVDYQ
jgi:hypothetical protein